LVPVMGLISSPSDLVRSDALESEDEEGALKIPLLKRNPATFP